MVASPVHGEELRPQLDDMVSHFARVVFGDEYGLNTGPKVIAKWQGPVGFTVQGRATQEMGNMLGRHLGGLAQLTGLKFHQVKPGTPGPTIDLLFLKRKEMANIKAANLDPDVIRSLTSDPTMVCFFLHWKKPDDRIIKAIVAVNVERDPAQIDSCLLEELTQVMGLPNDVEAYWPTLFKPYDTSVNWSEWDKLYIKTLYDARLKPGMKPVDAMYAARTIFAEALAKQP
ncbi:DUF2927 domain-containing protein [Magnetovibrio sp.]|uniref:DUF2927 domain-containing protein n=1 Tax=Magnetovibrio sp. TaxID=2024836 RepID=UPI002F921466